MILDKNIAIMDRQERDFKGIWIPKEIWLSKELTLQEKVFLVEIDSLDNNNGCYAGNQYFAEFFGISKTRVSLVVKSLQEKGYIKSTIIYKEGTKQILNRVLNICYRPSLSFIKDPTQGKLKGNNTINNTYNNKEEKEIAIALSAKNQSSINSDNHNKAVLSNEISLEDKSHEKSDNIYEQAAEIVNNTIKQPRSSVKKLTAAEKYEIEFNKSLKDGEVRHHKVSGEVLAPNFESVLSFCKTIGGDKDLANKFFDQYEASGWLAGNTKIKNWQSKLKAWKNQSDIWAAQEKRKQVLGSGIKRNPNTTDADAAYEKNMKKGMLDLF